MRRQLIVALVAITVCGAAAQSAGATVLLGDQKVEATSDTNGNGVTQAFGYTAVASGTPTDVEVYVGPNSASGLQVGIYSDSPGTPSRLLASGTLSAPTANTWNDVKLGGSPPAITSGTKYWISLGGTGSSGLLNFRDLTSGGTASYAANGLPSTWSSAGGPWPVGPASAYVNGTTGAPSPPTNTALPTITGTTQQGQTLSTTTGTWNGTTPITYTYQWQRCTTTCTIITGATSSTYTLTTNDVGDTIDVIVTATNSAGNATATSPKTATVTTPPPPPPGKITHVVWVLMENHGYSSIVGSSQAPYINQLANTHGLATNYFALSHPSLPNYIGLTSGGTQGISDDNDPSSHALTVPSIFSQLPGGQSRSLQ